MEVSTVCMLARCQVVRLIMLRDVPGWRRLVLLVLLHPAAVCVCMTGCVDTGFDDLMRASGLFLMYCFFFFPLETEVERGVRLGGHVLVYIDTSVTEIDIYRLTDVRIRTYIHSSVCRCSRASRRRRR